MSPQILLFKEIYLSLSNNPKIKHMTPTRLITGEVHLLRPTQPDTNWMVNHRAVVTVLGKWKHVVLKSLS